MKIKNIIENFSEEILNTVSGVGEFSPDYPKVLLIENKYKHKLIKLILKDFSKYCHEKYYKNCWPDKDGNWIYDYKEQIDNMVDSFINDKNDF